MENFLITKYINVTHVIRNISIQSGGLTAYIKCIIEALDGMVNQRLNCINAEDNIPIDAKIEISYYENNNISNWLSNKIVLGTTGVDIFHGNGLWQYPVHKMGKLARKKKLPYIISPHGMLEPWSLQQKRLKKKIALKFYQFRDLKLAACLHATAVTEAESIRALGLKNPIAVIPNGVPVEEFKIKDYGKPSEINKILFLSRIHPKKGIELLIEAWGQLPITLTNGWSVEIIGNGEETYISELNALIIKKGLTNNIYIKEPIYGPEKITAYQQAKLFVLPTYSENFGIVVAEALACGTPVITTQGTPWQDLETYECGWWIKTGVQPLIVALQAAVNLPSEALEVMGKNGRKLIEEKYSMQAVAQQMHQLYEWILKKREKPHFVRLD